jgi:hypothetical protein
MHGFTRARNATLALISPFVLAPQMASAQAPSAGAPAVEYRLTAERLACLRKNAAVYRKAQRDPLFIPLAKCPELPSDPLMGLLVNEGPGRGDKPATEESAILFLTKKQFECLLQAQTPQANLYRFRPQTCALAPVK